MKGQIEPPKNPDALALRSVEFSRILLIKPSALGDVVHTLPVLVKLRTRYPRAQIDWLITPENAEIVRYHPSLSNIVLFARRDFSKHGRRWRAFLSFFDLLKQIRSAKYELIIDMRKLPTSATVRLMIHTFSLCLDRKMRSQQMGGHGFIRFARHWCRGVPDIARC